MRNAAAVLFVVLVAGLVLLAAGCAVALAPHAQARLDIACETPPYTQPLPPLNRRHGTAAPDRSC